MNPIPLVTRLEQAVGLLDPGTKERLTDNEGAAYEAFVLHSIGAELSSAHGWEWFHPWGWFTFSTRNGCSLEEAVDRYPTVWTGDVVFTPSIAVAGRSGRMHFLDLALIDLDLAKPDTAWESVLAFLECKNVGRARGLETAQNLVGLAAELHLGAHYRLWASRGYTEGALVAAHGVRPTAETLLAHWKLHAFAELRPSTVRHIAPALAAWLNAAVP